MARQKKTTSVVEKTTPVEETFFEKLAPKRKYTRRAPKSVPTATPPVEVTETVVEKSDTVKDAPAVETPVSEPVAETPAVVTQKPKRQYTSRKKTVPKTDTVPKVGTLPEVSETSTSPKVSAEKSAVPTVVEKKAPKSTASSKKKKMFELVCDSDEDKVRNVESASPKSAAQQLFSLMCEHKTDSDFTTDFTIRELGQTKEHVYTGTRNKLSTPVEITRKNVTYVSFYQINVTSKK